MTEQQIYLFPPHISGWEQCFMHVCLECNCVGPDDGARATHTSDPVSYYQHLEIGYNYRLSNVLAGVGRGQLRVLQDRVDAHHRNLKYNAVSEAFFEHGLCLPSGSSLTEKDLDRIVSVIRDAVRICAGKNTTIH